MGEPFKGLQGLLCRLLSHFLVRSVGIGRDVSESIIITGDFNKIFVGAYGLLRDAYIEPWSILERVKPDHFIGREWLLKEIDAFLDGNDRGYFILEAEAGLGKTTFLAWLVRKRYYIHHFTELAPGEVGVETGLKNLAAQVIRAWKLDPCSANDMLPSAAEHPYFLQNLLFEAARSRDEIRPGEKIVLVVDALDEAGTPYGQNVLGLPKVLPEGVYCIVSQRPVEVRLMVEEGTCRVFRLQAADAHNLADMQAYLEGAATWEGIARALQESGYSAQRFVGTLLAKCQGVWIYLHYMVGEMERGKRSPLDLDTLPDGMTQYYTHYWKRWRAEHKDEWYKTHLSLLATLAAAQEAVTVERLANWANVEMSEELCELLKERWRPFITIANPDQQARYQFYHATLREFFEGRMDERHLTAGDQAFVKALRRATVDARRRIIESLRVDMQDTQKPEKTHRDAALRLTSLDWLTYVENVPPDEMLAYLELFARYHMGFPVQRLDLVKTITKILKMDLPDRQRAQLLVYRGGMRGQSKEFLDEAEEDYKRARQIVNRLIGSKAGLPADHKLSARIDLGTGNITVVRAETLAKTEDPKDEELQQELLQEAVELYRAAAQSTQAYGQDVILEVHIYQELSWTYALLKNWAQAVESYRSALEVLKTGKGRVDPGAYAIHYAWVLETAGDVHWKKGQRLVSKGNSSQALSQYETACKHAQKAITMLEGSLGESEELVFAHYNLGKYLLAMSECPGCSVSQPVDKACKSWQIALDMAHRLSISEMEQKASERLGRHCQNRETP